LNIKNYLKENWGAPFIIAFIILLLIAATELSFGLEAQANDVAVYAYYFLVAGVVLQIASYIKYGEKEEVVTETEKKQQKQKVPMSRRRKVIIVSSVLIILAASSFSLIYFQNSISSALPHKTYPELKAYLALNKVLREPDGSTVSIVGVTVTGGDIPYSFKANWGDGYVQNSSDPIFQRTFPPSSQIPGTVTIIVVSSDGQKVSVTASINATHS
jgi:hypothetical protein